MCITIDTAHLAKTKILSMVLNDKEHIIAYSNNVQNLSNGNNAMIFAIPGKLTQSDFYDTTSYANFLEELAEKSKNFYEFRSKSLSLSDDIESFKLGIYDIKISNVETLVDYIKSNQDIKISNDLLDFYLQKYSGQMLVICEFDTNKTSSAQPIMFKYTPTDHDILYFPMMDAHDGSAPKNKDVDRDHTVIWHHPSSEKNKMFDRNVIFDLKVPYDIDNKNYIKMKFNGCQKNGDLYINYKDENYEPKLIF